MGYKVYFRTSTIPAAEVDLIGTQEKHSFWQTKQWAVRGTFLRCPMSGGGGEANYQSVALFFFNRPPFPVVRFDP